ncbi:hypothetical protein IL306_007232 [Fusarium sp. DS 682]|nr:hypothetical protein IL306_007232 [Fusarium sp. DS 682]
MNTKATEKPAEELTKETVESSTDKTKKPNMALQGKKEPEVQANNETVPEANEKRYASYYGDGSGLPLHPGSRLPETEEGFQEWYKEIKAREEKIFNMPDEEFHAKYGKHKPCKEFSFSLEEARVMLFEYEDVKWAHTYGDGSGLILRPGMGPPMTEEEFEEHYKKIKAKEDELFNMSDEEFYAKYPQYKDYELSPQEDICDHGDFDCCDHDYSDNEWDVQDESGNHHDGKK